MPDSIHIIQQKIRRAFKLIPRDVVGIEFRSDAPRALRLKRVNQKNVLVAAEALAPEAAKPGVPLALPASLKGVHASLIYDGEDALAKMISLPGTAAIEESRLREALGLDKEEQWRISHRVLQPGSRRSDSLILCAALPEAKAAELPAKLSASKPVPDCIELSQLAVMNAFAATRAKSASGIQGLVFADTDYCMFAFFRDGEPILLRRFAGGSGELLERVAGKLNIPPQEAADIVRSGVVDLSGPLADFFTPFIRQVTLSRDFIERHANNRLTHLILGGEPVLCDNLRQNLQASLHVETAIWDPFEEAGLDTSALPAVESSPWTFFAALGGCLGMLDQPKEP